MQLSLSNAQSSAVEQAVLSKLITQSTSNLRSAKSYLTLLTIDDPEQKELEDIHYVLAVWEMQFVSPNRFHVDQGMWDRGRHKYVYDQWIDIGQKHFDNVGIWISGPSPSRQTMDTLLTVDKFAEILDRQKPEVFRMYSFGAKQYLLLDYHLTTLDSFGAITQSFEPPAQVRVWVDAQTALLARADVSGQRKEHDGSRSPLHLSQEFAGFNAHLDIKQPRVNAKAE
jgi:hypothetical protein